MKTFGTNEYGNKDGFKIICCKCGNEGWLVPTHHYIDKNDTTHMKITAEFRCSCGNRFGSVIHLN